MASSNGGVQAGARAAAVAGSGESVGDEAGSNACFTVGIQMTNDLTSQETRSDHAHHEAIWETATQNIRFEDLPVDVLHTIVSKLTAKELARTRILSSRWRCMMLSACPRLTFDGVVVCKCDRADLQQHIGKFIHQVNAVLQKHHGIVVETLEIRIDFVDDILVHRLNNWVSFAVSSRTKNLTLDLKPKRFWQQDRRYEFPFKLLDNDSMSRLHHLQLSFASLKPPSQFRGFPNLRKLYIQILHVGRKDLEHVLSFCCNLEWLRIDRCHLDDELMVDGSLSHLRYLYIEHCRITKIKFHAVNLATFLYEGNFISMDFSQSSKLQNAYIKLGEAVLQHALASLLNGIPHVQNLTFRVGWPFLEKQWTWDNPLKFSNLRHLQLFMHLYRKEIGKFLYSVSFLRATPFIEKLEVHFTGYLLWLAKVGPLRQELGRCEYFYLKNIHISGFKGAREQVEFLLHVVENAPALEVLTVNTTEEAAGDYWPYKGSPPFEEAKRIAITSLTGTPTECQILCYLVIFRCLSLCQILSTTTECSVCLRVGFLSL